MATICHSLCKQSSLAGGPLPLGFKAEGFRLRVSSSGMAPQVKRSFRLKGELMEVG